MKILIGPNENGEYNRGQDVVVALLESKEKPEHFLVQFRSPDKAYPSWIEFPGGKVESSESPEMALVREVKEEVGVEIKKLRWFTSMDYLFPSGLYHNVHFYEIPVYDGNPLGCEGQKIGWLTLYQLITYPNCLPLNRAAAVILTTERHPDILDIPQYLPVTVTSNLGLKGIPDENFILSIN